MKVTTPIRIVYRIARQPWVIRAPSQLHRFDINDSENPVCTVYVGESETAAFAEVLAPLRPDLKVLSDLKDMPHDQDSPLPATGRVSLQWLKARRIGAAHTRSSATVVDVTSAETISYLREVPSLAQHASECGFTDLDDSALKTSGARGRFFTQAIAAWIYNQGYNVIRYGSRLGAEFNCLAGFVPVARCTIIESEFLESILPDVEISTDNPALVGVGKIFNLSIDKR